MGVAPLFCCFRSQQPNCMALTGLAASIVAFAFMIWGLADLWFDRKGVEAIYIIAFILVCISLVAFIIIFIFLNLRKTESYRTINNVGRIFCLVILIMCFVAFICLVIMALAANILYKVFYDNVMATPYPVHITQNSMTTTPNPPQPVIFPVTNGPAYPTPNNVPYPVTIQQSGVIMNK